MATSASSKVFSITVQTSIPNDCETRRREPWQSPTDDVIVRERTADKELSENVKGRGKRFLSDCLDVFSFDSSPRPRRHSPFFPTCCSRPTFPIKFCRDFECEEGCGAKETLKCGVRPNPTNPHFIDVHLRRIEGSGLFDCVGRVQKQEMARESGKHVGGGAKNRTHTRGVGKKKPETVRKGSLGLV
ncbi:hypothetical protein BLNAU_12323 [Blattamonas nauphoetae]|uniref:Uncharacterized protein n=1 Tax=Blattamonas nauphoetae TaxID=2049346 RepID=A0ABQ9XPF0_9EUKA|nr:hypothetical protein BLNAU_12323 [Blattamonas nauphoetae]